MQWHNTVSKVDPDLSVTSFSWRVASGFFAFIEL